MNHSPRRGGFLPQRENFVHFQEYLTECKKKIFRSVTLVRGRIRLPCALE